MQSSCARRDGTLALARGRLPCSMALVCLANGFQQEISSVCTRNKRASRGVEFHIVAKKQGCFFLDLSKDENSKQHTLKVKAHNASSCGICGCGISGSAIWTLGAVFDFAVQARLQLGFLSPSSSAETESPLGTAMHVCPHDCGGVSCSIAEGTHSSSRPREAVSTHAHVCL